MSLTIFGLQFHLYGLLVGVGIAVGYVLAERKAKPYFSDNDRFSKVLLGVLFGGVVGARLYHVITDWPLYQNHFWQAFQLWNGGLSIIGAIAGGAAGGGLALRLLSKNLKSFRHEVAVSADIAALCIPFAQAIGRLGNYFNQELYGLPTTLPWAIPISPKYRASGYEQYDTFHPLFAYEAIGLVTFALFLWWLEKTKKWSVGSGTFALAYLAFYGIYRGVLEFLRIQKVSFGDTGFGVNQIVLFVIGGVAVAGLLLQLRKKTYAR